MIKICFLSIVIISILPDMLVSYQLSYTRVLLGGVLFISYKA